MSDDETREKMTALGSAATEPERGRSSLCLRCAIAACTGMPTRGFDNDPPKGLEAPAPRSRQRPADGTTRGMVEPASGCSAGCARHGLEAHDLPLPQSNSLRPRSRLRSCFQIEVQVGVP